jgi:hypothetical protein
MFWFVYSQMSCGGEISCHCTLVVLPCSTSRYGIPQLLHSLFYCFLMFHCWFCQTKLVIFSPWNLYFIFLTSVSRSPKLWRGAIQYCYLCSNILFYFFCNSTTLLILKTKSTRFHVRSNGLSDGSLRSSYLCFSLDNDLFQLWFVAFTIFCLFHFCMFCQLSFRKFSCFLFCFFFYIYPWYF